MEESGLGVTLATKEIRRESTVKPSIPGSKPVAGATDTPCSQHSLQLEKLLSPPQTIWQESEAREHRGSKKAKQKYGRQENML